MLPSDPQRHRTHSLDPGPKLATSWIVDEALHELRAAAVGDTNLMPPIIKAAKAYVTLGKMTDALREVWGEYLPFRGGHRSGGNTTATAYACV